MVSENQSSYVNIDLNQVVQDVLLSVEDTSDTNSNSIEDIPLHFDLNEEAHNEDMGNVNQGDDQDGDAITNSVNNNADGGDEEAESRQEDANCTPTVGMLFESSEEFARFCHKYAYDKGFQFYIRSNRLLKEYREGGVIRQGVGEKEPNNHMMSRIRLVCKMGTKDRRKNKTGRKIASASPQYYSQLMVNHRSINDGSYEQMSSNDSTGISLAKSYNSLVITRGGQENVTFS
uniref:FAR1 domain-containing protein n=1 Tax=Chenopodium quinoa TaxID=63459 RepID=A0A803LZ22_CHEQI